MYKRPGQHLKEAKEVEGMWRSCEMVQQVKVFAIKVDHLSLISGTDTMK